MEQTLIVNVEDVISDEEAMEIINTANSIYESPVDYHKVLSEIHSDIMNG